MSAFDDRQRSVTGRLQIPGLVSELSPEEQLPFPEHTSSQSRTTRRLEFDSSPNVSEIPEDALVSPGITRTLPDVNTGPLSFSPAGSTTTALRQPVVIPGTGKKSPGLIRPPKGRKQVISVSVLAFLLTITLGTAFAVSPLQGESGPFTNPIQLVANLVHNTNNNPSLIAQQATATAAQSQGGYDPVSGGSTSPGAGGLYRFAYGYCTYWANMRYHQLTGYWVPWLGNAYEWKYGAMASGWIVSSTPRVPSIIVLQPGVQGAGYLGHVAVVERINSDGSVYTSDWNWYANGGWAILSYVTFTPGSGVSFVWHP